MALCIRTVEVGIQSGGRLAFEGDVVANALLDAVGARLGVLVRTPGVDSKSSHL